MTTNDDPFILASDPQGLRNLGIPMHPATALRLAKNGDFIPATFLSPRRSGWFASALLAWKEAKRTAA